MQIGKFWAISENAGPWQLASYNDGMGILLNRNSSSNARAGSWYIVNRENGKSKRIGPVKMSGTNYSDKARDEAHRRNQELGFEN